MKLLPLIKPKIVCLTQSKKQKITRILIDSTCHENFNPKTYIIKITKNLFKL